MARQSLSEALGVGNSVSVIPGGVAQPLRVFPDRYAVLAPEDAQRPARQGFARIPLALRAVQQGARRQPVAQAACQHLGAFALVRAERGGGPFGRVHVVDRDEGRLAALRQAHVHCVQLAIHQPAEGADVRPLVFGVGLSDARIFLEARDGVTEFQRGFAGVGKAGDGRGGRGMRRAGQRDVTLAGEQAGGRVEADPAGAGYENFRPRMQVGEVGFRAGRAIERFLVGGELHQIAGDEARGQSEMSQDLHQQPGRIAAGAELACQRFFAALHAGLQADGVADVLLQVAVDVDEEIDDLLRLALDASQVSG